MLSLFASADTLDAGRLDPTMLSDTQLLELCVVTDGNAHLSSILGGEEDDSCTWKGIQCDEDQNVFEIALGQAQLQNTGATVAFAFFPPHLTNLGLRYAPVSGTVELRYLPPSMQAVNIISTLITGTLDCSALPRSMETLRIIRNRISGLVGIGNLPKTLRTFFVSEYGLKGQVIQVGKLPESLEIRLANSYPREIRCEVPGDTDRVKYNGKSTKLLSPLPVERKVN